LYFKAPNFGKSKRMINKKTVCRKYKYPGKILQVIYCRIENSVLLMNVLPEEIQ